MHEILRPQDDLVRRDFVDDPAGGVLDRAPDPLLPWLPEFLRPRQACTSSRPAAMVE